jgi:mannosyltransferase
VSVKAGDAAGVKEDTEHRRFLLAVLGVLGVLWLLPLTSSFWIDETATRWTIDRGFGTMVHRSIEFQWQSPLWFGIEWAWARIAGTSELALRIPSVVPLLAGVWIFYRLALRLLGPRAALPATVVFASLDRVAFAAGDARPYAAGLTALIGAAFLLTRWIDTGGARYRNGAVVLAAVSVYCHYTFGLALIPLTLYAIAQARSGRLSRKDVVVAVVSLALLLVPAAVHTIWVSYQSTSNLVPPGDSSFVALLRAFVPLAIVGVVAGLLAAAVALRRVRIVADDETAPGSLLFIGSWVIAVPLGLFIAARLGTPRFFTARYMSSAAPGVALLVGWILGRVSPRVVMRVAVGAIALVGVLGSGGRYHTFEHWREAAAVARAETDRGAEVVLLHDAFIEATLVDWLEDRGERSSAIMAPALMYPMGPRVLPMPFFIDRGAEGYLERLSADTLRSTRRFVLVTQMPWVPLRRWLDEHLASDGFASKEVGSAGVIRIYVFERAGSGP